MSVVLLLLVGCGKSGPRPGILSGTVTYKGQPVNNSVLVLTPTSGEGGGVPFTIPVDSDGKFRTSGVPEGDYKVVVQGTGAAAGSSSGGGAPGAAKPTIQFPNKYKQPQTSDLTCKVGKGEQALNLELKD